MDYTPIIKGMADSMAAELGSRVKADQTFSGMVTQQVNSCEYKIRYRDSEVKAVSSIPCETGDYVWVCAPMGNWNELFIVGKKPSRNVKAQ